MPSYSFNLSIQSIIQSIINFFEKLFGITREQPIKTQSSLDINYPKTISEYHPLPSNIIKHKNKNITPPKMPILPIITRHKVNINNSLINKRLPILPAPIIRHKVNIKNPTKISLPKSRVLPIKIIPNKPLSQVLKNNSKTNNIKNNISTNNTSTNNTTNNISTNNTSTTNLSQIAINPNIPLSQTLTQGRTIIPARHKNPNGNNGNNENNSSQSNNTSKSNSKSIIVNPVEYKLYNTIKNSKSINLTKSNRKNNKQ